MCSSDLIFGSTRVTVVGTGFAWNRASGNGGAIHSSSGSVAVSDGTLFGNVAAGYGGGIYASTGVTITDGTYTEVEGDSLKEGDSLVIDAQMTEGGQKPAGGQQGPGGPMRRVF